MLLTKISPCSSIPKKVKSEIAVQKRGICRAEILFRDFYFTLVILANVLWEIIEIVFIYIYTAAYNSMIADYSVDDRISLDPLDSSEYHSISPHNPEYYISISETVNNIFYFIIPPLSSYFTLNAL